MSDEFPESVELEVDRDALRRYLRTKWFLSWLACLAIFGGMFGLLLPFSAFSLEKGAMYKWPVLKLYLLATDLCFRCLRALTELERNLDY